MDISLKIQRATPENFAGFGRIVLPYSRPADFSCAEFDWWGNLAELSLGETAEVGIVEGKNLGSYEQKILEQHQNSVEVMIPTENDIFLVLAKPDAFSKETVDPSDFAAFYAPLGAMIVLDPGVWHQGPMTLADRARAFVIFRGKTGSDDKVELDMASRGLHLEVTGI